MAAIEVRDEAGVRWITFCRPKTLNALLQDGLDAITRALRDAEPDTQAAVLTGAARRLRTSDS